MNNNEVVQVFLSKTCTTSYMSKSREVLSARVSSKRLDRAPLHRCLWSLRDP